MKKKNIFLWSSSISNEGKKKSAQKAVGWATAHLPVLSHDTMECIVTQGLVGQHSAQQVHRGRSTIRSDWATI